VNKIRVLLANHPMMIPDAIRQLLAEQEDMEVVGDCRGPMKILQETGRVHADAVILAQEGTEEPVLCGQLLAIYPDLTILSVTPDLASVFTQQLSSCRREFANRHQEDMLDPLRTAIRMSRLSPREVCGSNTCIQDEPTV